MIPSGVQMFVALEPIDMRWSFDRLAADAAWASMGPPREHGGTSTACARVPCTRTRFNGAAA